MACRVFFCVLCCPFLFSGQPDNIVNLTCNGDPLKTALQSIAQQAELDLVYADHLVQGVRVRCRYTDITTEAALDAVLKGTGVSWKRAGDNRIVLFPLPADKTRSLKGTILALPAGNALEGAVVSIMGSHRLALTDHMGHFQMNGLALELDKVEIFATGYTPQTLELSDGAGEFRIAMAPQPHVSEHLRVTGGGLSLMNISNNDGASWLSPEAVAAAHGDLGRDLFDQLELLPGVSAGDAGDPGVSFRGGAPSENLVLLDGIKVYQPDHAMGYYSSVNTDALSEIRVFKSGYPARYSDRLSGVLDLSTRGERIQKREIRAGVNRDIADATVAQPLSRNASIMLSARRSMEDDTTNRVSARVHEQTFNDEVWQPEDDEELDATRQLDFTDLIGKLSWWSSGHDVSVSYFRGRDDSLDKVVYTGEDTPITLYDRKGNWGNKGLGLNWTGNWNDRLRTQAGITWSKMDAFFDFYDNNEGDVQEALVDNTLEEKSFFLDERFQIGNHTIETGVVINEIETFFNRRELFEDLEDEEPEEEEEPEELEEDGYTNSTRQKGFYLQDTWRPTDAFEASIGLHLREDERTGQRRTEPRIAMGWQPTQKWNLRASWGRYHQYILRTPDTINYFEGADTWFLADDFLMPGEARHLQVGAGYRHNGLMVDLELYDKRVTGTLNRLYDPLRNDNFESGIQSQDRIKGLDLLARKTIGNFSAMVSYGWMKGRAERDVHTGEALDHPTDRDIPHSLKAVLGYGAVNWRGSLIYSYASGRPFGIPGVAFESEEEDFEEEDFEFPEDFEEVNEEEFGGELILTQPEFPNQFRLPDRQQIDASIRYLWTWRKLDGELGLTLRNLTDRRNVLYRYYILDDEEDQPAPVDVTDFGFRASLDMRIRY
ncbi:MAG: TonB-dependent receptor [Acidobacteriota bacterium]|nr:TonB-dependent receptor [Acidobacteriota bacterium]